MYSMISSEYFSAPICPFSISKNFPVDLLMDKQECRHTSDGSVVRRRHKGIY